MQNKAINQVDINTIVAEGNRLVDDTYINSNIKPEIKKSLFQRFINSHWKYAIMLMQHSSNKN